MPCTRAYAFVPPANTVIDANSITPVLPPCVLFVPYDLFLYSPVSRLIPFVFELRVIVICVSNSVE